MDVTAIFDDPAPIIGMVHLPPLPGAPGFDGDRTHLRERARSDAAALDGGGVDGIIVENFGDAPFHPATVPNHVVASMTDIARVVTAAVDRPVGVNVLRNDAAAAIGIAAAVGAPFVRVNVHTGARVTDQGVIEGRAHETMRLRERLDADVAVLADVDVKHSAPLATDAPGLDPVVETVDRGLADGVIVSGTHTGAATDPAAVAGVADRVADAGLDVPVFVGSGVTPDTVADLLDVADGVIVGTALKVDGETTNPVDRDRVAALVDAARG